MEEPTRLTLEQFNEMCKRAMEQKSPPSEQPVAPEPNRKPHKKVKSGLSWFARLKLWWKSLWNKNNPLYKPFE